MKVWPRIAFALALAVAGLTADMAASQDCMVLDKAVAKKVADDGGATCKVSCSGCGCKGGPGYRAPPTENSPKGNCVSYRSLNSVCGPPPHAGCTRECAPVVSGCTAPDTAGATDFVARQRAPAEKERPEVPPPAAESSRLGTDPIIPANR